ncbi:MAG TPA: molybdate ABC transporter substrate-binding protein [Pyrinomonadaceae bacterium]|nr:molybdate ABC transporter substrate-binding protein [Pyrinomonadaceae bacterium]
MNSFRLKRHARRLALPLLLALALAACTREARREEPNLAGTEITVAAASNLTDVFEEVSKSFGERTGVRVVHSFGATADLARQIRNGAPFDVFAAADVPHVLELEREGFVTPFSPAVYARGRLALWTPPGGRVRLARLEDLARPEVTRIALARPEVAPYGQAAADALRALNLWDELEPKVVYAQNVSQARQFAASGNADAAFVPRSLVKAGDGEALDVDESLHRPLEQAAGVVKASTKQEAARRFVEFLLSDEGQKIFERYGYRRPEAAKQ